MIIKELCNKKIIDLSYGWDHYFARSIDNKIYCWGNNACGQLGKGIRVSENPSIMNINKLTDYDEEQMNEPELNVYLSELNINVIKCGALHSLALTQSGEVYAWGFNEFGQIGNCCNENQLVPTKIDSFDNEQVIMLSCGLMHSMVLTKSGRVFRWGDHKLEYSRIESSEELNKPKQLDLNNLAIVKISCGLFHSLLLDEDGVIYALGYPYSCRDDIGNNGIEQKLKKLDHVKIFLDIASHYCESTSIALSFDNIFYIWGGCKENIFAIQIGTEFKSFNQIFSHYFDYYSEISEELIEFTDSFFQNGFYKKYFNELYSIGKESYGKVYEILSKKSREILSEIKIIRLKREFKNEILREFHNKSLVEEILDQYVIEHISAWLKNSNNDDNIILYVLLESCYEGSGQIMKEMDGLIGCYKGIYLFNDILEYVEYLYKNFKQKNSNTSISEMKDETYNLRFIKSDDYVHLAIYENAEQSKISFFKQNENIAKISQKKQYEFDIYYFGTHLSKILDMDM
jgi:alpha-tubulin suppressor-like RCC1 family protein